MNLFDLDAMNLCDLIKGPFRIDDVIRYIKSHPDSIHETCPTVCDNGHGRLEILEMTPFHLACLKQRSPSDFATLVEALILHGHDYNAKATFKYSSISVTPVYEIMFMRGTHCPLSMLNTFLDVCERHSVFPDMNFRNSASQDTIIIDVVRTWRNARHLSVEMINSLLERLIVTFGADPNIQNSTSATILSFIMLHPDVFQRALELGARPASYQTILQASVYPQILHLLAANGVIVNCEHASVQETFSAFSIVAYESHDITEADYLIACGFNVNVLSITGENMINCMSRICFFAQVGTPPAFLKLMSYFIEKRVDINHVPIDGVSALTNAIRTGCLKRVKLLMEAGCIIPFAAKFDMNDVLRITDNNIRTNEPSFDTQEHQECIAYVNAFLAQQEQKRRIAFLMGLHCRLGADSPVALLNQDVISLIFKH